MVAEQARRPFVIGVTGNIACGKSTVVTMMAERGAVVIDADKIYHRLIESGQPLWHAIRGRFGDRIVAGDGEIDRRALGRIVFNDPAQLAELEALTHPAVIQAVRETVAIVSSGVVVIDAVKLVESGMAAMCDVLWLVLCSPAAQLERLMARSGLTEDDARRRITSQPDVQEKLLFANEVIDNSGSVVETRRAVDQAWSRLPILQS